MALATARSIVPLRGLGKWVSTETVPRDTDRRHEHRLSGRHADDPLTFEVGPELVELLHGVPHPVHLTRTTEDAVIAQRWLAEEGTHEVVIPFDVHHPPRQELRSRRHRGLAERLPELGAVADRCTCVGKPTARPAR